MSSHARRAFPALCVSLLAAAPAAAGDVWQFMGAVGLNAGRTDNPTLAARKNPNFDPTNALCLPPNNPNDNANICTMKFLPAGANQGDITGSLRLDGGVAGRWDNTDFDLNYVPTAYFYQDRSYLNQVGHDLYSTWRHRYTPRTSLNFSENFHHTPEQDLDPNNLQQNNLFTLRTSRTNNTFRGAFSFMESARTTLTWSYRNVLRAFSSRDYIDSLNQDAGFEWKRQVGPHSFVTSGYEFGTFSFSQNQPGSQHHQMNVGYGFESPRGLNLTLSVGYNILVPDDSSINNSSGIYTNSSFGWQGPRLSASGGYAHGFSDGGGVYTNAQTRSSFANLRFTFTPKLTSDIAATRNVHERIDNLVAGASTSEVIRSFNGRAALNYAVVRNVGLNATYTHYLQETSSQTGAVPDVRSHRYSLGITWSFH